MRTRCTPFLIATGLALISPAEAAARASAAGTETPASPAAAPASNPESIPLETGEGRKVATTLADELLKTFVIPTNAKDYSAMLRANADAGRYDTGTRGELAKRLTDDMLAVHKDGHLHVEILNANGTSGGRVGGKPLPPLIQSAKWIAPGIAYIRPSAFKSTPEEVAAFKAFMEEHKEAETIIFDLRNHHGGRLGEMDVIFPYLFAEKTPLVKMEMARSVYDENGSPFGADGPTLSVEKGAETITTTHFAVPGPVTPLRTAKVFLLVSNASASAAEHFSLAMKSTGRGTLIGEATAGANHFGGGVELNDHFGVWMPFGRSYDIKTGKDWEGGGIQPDIAVDPKLALVKALELAGLSHAQAVKLDSGEVPSEPVHKEKLAAR
jgi:hypothetical protein